MNNEWQHIITINADQCGGRPCIRGMRSRVTDIIDLMANGFTQQQVLEELPDLTSEDVQAALRYVSQRLDDKFPAYSDEELKELYSRRENVVSGNSKGFSVEDVHSFVRLNNG